MAHVTHARLDASIDADFRPAAAHALSRAVLPVVEDVQFDIYEDVAEIEREWRALEQRADCTVFQTYDWLATWHELIGAPQGVKPAVVVGRDVDGAVLFLLPLCVQRRRLVRELTWLGSGLCDYNAPLLAPNFSRVVPPARAERTVKLVLSRLQQHPRLGYDLVQFDKMPEVVGTQHNPLLCLRTTANPSGAHMTQLGADWETFYRSKRSSSTRRRDRTKRKRLAEIGEVRLVTPAAEADVLETLDTLLTQKARSFARMGVANIFEGRGYRDFYRAVSTRPTTRHLTHVSRLQAGDAITAVNLGLTFRGCYYHLLASYDDGELSRFGPGAAHLHELMQFAIERRFRTFDFTIGDESYKSDWCEINITLYDHVSAATLRGAMIVLPIYAKRTLKRWIKQTPVLWSAFSQARALLGRLRGLGGAARTPDEHVQAEPAAGDEEQQR
jgi:CelD/BcsL family acetyltransferase involved in cellulose biosynthesis